MLNKNIMKILLKIYIETVRDAISFRGEVQERRRSPTRLIQPAFV